MDGKSKIEDVLTKTVEIIARDYQAEKIVLFGSYAYGSADEESDVDLLIVKETDKPFFQRLFEVQRLVSETRRGYGFYFIVLYPTEVKERLEIGDQFIKEILTQGVVMYER